MLNGLHYDNDTYKKVYNYMKSGISSTNSYSGNTGIMKKVNYYFKTNLEGLLMFQSQYDWHKLSYVGSNSLFIFSGYLISWFKYFIYALLIVRMLGIAILTAFLPIVVVINAFSRISGNKGLLKKWLLLYLSAIFIKMVIEILYYIFMKSAVKTVASNPFYPVLIIILMFIFTFMYLNKMRKILFSK